MKIWRDQQNPGVEAVWGAYTLYKRGLGGGGGGGLGEYIREGRVEGSGWVSMTGLSRQEVRGGALRGYYCTHTWTELGTRHNSCLHHKQFESHL